MTKKQKLQMEEIAKRQKINELLALDEITDAQRAELETLTKRMQEIGIEMRAAIVAEGDDEARARGMFGPGDGEAGERGRLLRETTLADYLGTASAGGALEGRAKELNEALEVPVAGEKGGCPVPWEMLAVPESRATPEQTEDRAFATTTQNDGGETQRPVLARLFGRSIFAALGVRLDAVPVGRVEWPLFNTGVAPAPKAEGTAADAAVAPGFNFANLVPKRLTGQYEFTHEMSASVAAIEAHLRRDLAASVRSKMSEQALSGDGTSPNVSGLFQRIAQPAVPGAVITASDFLGLSALGVDGIHAESAAECSILMGTASYKLLTKTQSTTGDGPIFERLRTRAARILASSFIPAPPDSGARQNVQDCVIHAGMDEQRGDSVAAVWPTLEIVRDPYTKASQGVVLTWISLWDCFMAFRQDAYVRTALKLA